MVARPSGVSVDSDIAARSAVVSSMVWLIVAALLTVALWARTAFPFVGSGLSFLGYGRLRSSADTALVFGFLTQAGFAAVFALLPRLTGVRLHNEVLGGASVIWWNLVLAIGIGTLLAGYNQGRPLAEMPLAVDAALVFTLLAVAYNVLATVARRRERTLYAGALYLMAAVVWFLIVFVAGNVGIFEGLGGWLVSAFYVQGIQVLWLLPVLGGAAVVVVPTATGNGLYSRKLGLIGFWTLAAVGGWSALRATAFSSAPETLQAVSIAMSVVLLLPVLTLLSNLFATARGAWSLAADDFGLRWTAVGLVALTAWAGLAALASQPAVARIAGFTSVEDGLRRLAFWMAFGSLAFGFLMHMHPRLTGRTWWSRRASSFHFWATLTAAAMLTGIQFAAGFIQAGSQLAGHRPVSVGATAAGSLAAASVLALAQIVFVVNAYKTSHCGEALYGPYAVAVEVRA